MRGRRGPVAAASCALLLLVNGCGYGQTTAERFATNRAMQLHRELELVRLRDHTVLELARRLTGDGDEQDVTVLRAHGSPLDNDAVIVAQVYAYASGSVWNPPSEATLCFEYRIEEYDVHRPREIDCPEGKPIAIPTPSPEPRLPPDAVERVTGALRDLNGQNDEASVRQAATAAVEPVPVTLDVQTPNEWTGLAVRTGSDCLLARVRGRTVEVWIPPAVTVQPGELTCDATTAAYGLAKRPPH